MKPAPCAYAAPHTVEEATALLAAHTGDAKVLAGGQSLVPMLNFRLLEPALLVDINRIAGLDSLVADAAGLRIGALVRHRAIETSPAVAAHFPVLAAAMTEVGHLAIRNRGTFGGSLAHADPAAELPLLALLLDARLTVVSAGGSRTVAAADFFEAALTTALAPDEILTEATMPALPAKCGWGFQEFARRAGDFALAAVGVVVAEAEGRCRMARIAMAGVGPTTLRAPAAEALLQDTVLDADAIAAAAGEAAAAAQPETDLHASGDYRRHLVEVLTRRALAQAVGRTRGDAR